jgi:iron complex outermembrane receptor protein
VGLLLFLETLIMKKLIYIGLSVIAFSALANTSMADELEEVIVTSSLIDPLANDISNPLHILGAKSISSDATQSLGSIINGLVGISTSDFGAGVGQPVIRGLGGSRVKVLNNGNVVRDVSALGPDHLNQIDLGHLQQIEIIRGPSSLLYANGAVGGIVNIVDNTIAKQDITDAKFEIGAGYEDGNRGNTGTASYQGNVNGINVTSSIQYSNLDVYAIPEHALHLDEGHDGHDHEVEEDPTSLKDSDFANFNAKIGFSKVADWGYAGVSVADSNTTYGIPFHGEHFECEEASAICIKKLHDGEIEFVHVEPLDPLHPVDDHCAEHPKDCETIDGELYELVAEEEERIFTRVDSKTVTFEGLYNFNGGFINSAEYSIRDTDYVHVEAHEELGGHDEHDEEHKDEEEHEHEGHGPTTFSNQSTELAVKFDIGDKSKGQKVALNVAQEEIAIFADHGDEDEDDHHGESYLEPTQSDELTLGYYLSNKLDFAHIDFGVRYDLIDRETEDGHSYDDSLLSFSFAASKQLSDNLDVSLGLSSVEKAPSAMELFVDGDHMVTQLHEVGDDSLTTEKANNIDLTFNTAASGFDIELSLFKNSISDFIYLNKTGEFNETPNVLDDLELEIAKYMQQDATFEGYELQISRLINLTNGSLLASLGRDSVDSQFDQGGYIPRSVPTRNILSFSYNGNNGLDWSLSIKDVQKQSNVASEEEEEDHHNEVEEEHEHEEHGETPTDGYQWVNFSLSKEIKTSESEAITVSFFAKNLLNEVARNHSSFVKDEVPLPGRNLGFKVNYSF